jgi:hypothetical protein
MSNSLYKKIAGIKPTMGPITGTLLGVCKAAGWENAFIWLFSNFTDEGKMFRRYQSIALDSQKRIQSIIDNSPVLRAWEKTVNAATENSNERMVWWVLFDLFTVEQMVRLHNNWLSCVRRQDVLVILNTCNEIFNLLQENSMAAKNGLVLKEKEYLQCMARTWIAQAIFSFNPNNGSVSQIAHRLARA